jgi:hypothetical protein
MLPSPQMKQGSNLSMGVGATVGVVALFSRIQEHKLSAAMNSCKTTQLEENNIPRIPKSAASAQVIFPVGKAKGSFNEMTPVTHILHTSEVGAGLREGKAETVGNAVTVGGYVVVGRIVVGRKVAFVEVGRGASIGETGFAVGAGATTTEGRATPPEGEGACELTDVTGAVGTRTVGPFCGAEGTRTVGAFCATKICRQEIRRRNR